MVLEASDRASDTGLELAFEQDVSDHPSGARHGLVREELRPRHEESVTAPVAAAEQLIPAAHDEQGRATGDRRSNGGAFRCEIGSDERLLSILTAADVQQIV